MRRLLSGGALGLAALLGGAEARAEELGMLGYDARTSAVAGASVALGSSPGVTYTNPALLSGAGAQVSGGLMVFRPMVSAARVGGAPSGVPLSVYDSTLGLDQRVQTRPLPTAELPQRRGDNVVKDVEFRLGLGATAQLWEGRLSLGAVVGLPALGGDRANVATHYADEREAAFSNRVWPLRLGGWQRVADAVFGGAFQATRWLSLGVAGQVEAMAVARIGVYVPDASVQDNVNSNMATSIETSLRPILGARARLGRWLAAGLVLRGESYFSVDAASEVTLWNYHQAGGGATKLKRSTQKIPVVFGYKPLEIAAAFGATLGAVEVEMTATFQQWSRYLDHHGERPEEAARFPEGYEGVPFNPDRFRFKDRVGLALGGRWRVAPWAQLSAGVSYQPSPVPAQVGRTSYADSDLLGVTFGERITLGDWSLDLAAQLWRLASRTTYKNPALVVDEVPDGVRSLRENKKMPEMEGLQTNNPGFPGFEVGGVLLAGSLFATRTF